MQKTALKLLLVFVEYAESNCELLVDAIVAVDKSAREKPWCNVMKILSEKDPSDPELLVFAMTLINMVRVCVSLKRKLVYGRAVFQQHCVTWIATVCWNNEISHAKSGY